uniref:hypothetical protein n=1 Tax=Vibrio vulnificus TaxID=672 RepID=UPI001A93A6C0
AQHGWVGDVVGTIKQLAPFMDCPERAKENVPRTRNTLITKERPRMKTRSLCFDAPPHPALPVFLGKAEK